jgi:hypothetical protein
MDWVGYAVLAAIGLYAIMVYNSLVRLRARAA